MWAPISFLIDTFRESFGTPVRLRHLIDKHPEACVQIKEPQRVIDASSVVPWHEWGKHFHSSFSMPGWIMGWKCSDNHYTSFKILRPELMNFGRCNLTDRWDCEIQDVSGFSHSKSTLTDFICMDDMVMKNSPEMIDQISEAWLRENLAHDQIRILHNHNTIDHFARHLWDGRLFLMNSGGSHHFAAARHISSRIGVPVPLTGKLRTYSINPEAVATLKRDFDIYVVSQEAEIANGFHDAMQSFKATYLLYDLPRPYERSRAILLPKDEQRSRQVSNMLREAGAFDLGQHLTDLCIRQTTMPMPVQVPVGRGRGNP